MLNDQQKLRTAGYHVRHLLFAELLQYLQLRYSLLPHCHHILTVF